MNGLMAIIVSIGAGSIAQATTYTEKIGRCVPDKADAAFTSISIQGDTDHKDKGLMVQVASDGLIDVFEAKLTKKPKGLEIKLSDGRVLFADYSTTDAAAVIKYNGVIYSCDREQ
jgi:hypothetical protein